LLNSQAAIQGLAADEPRARAPDAAGAPNILVDIPAPTASVEHPRWRRLASAALSYGWRAPMDAPIQHDAVLFHRLPEAVQHAVDAEKHSSRCRCRPAWGVANTASRRSPARTGRSSAARSRA
jgi:hypothetical protein